MPITSLKPSPQCHEKKRIRDLFFRVTAFILLTLQPGALLCSAGEISQEGGISQEKHEEIWSPAPYDAKRAIRNDSRPADRKMPVHILPPLSQEDRGLIRNVTPEKGEKVLALTFDLCELDTSTTGCDMDLLGYLHREGCAATLFMGGKWMRSHEKRVKQIMRTPLFEIGNHAWSHGNAALLTKKGLQAQILWTQAEYERLREDLQHSAKVSGETLPPSPAVPHLFRLPYGRCTVEALHIIADLGLRTVQWDIPAEGRPVRSQQEAARAAKALLSRIKPGSILLLHANRVPTGTALLVKELVPLLRKSGYRFCTVGELLEMGKANISWDGYFDRPKDNHGLDRRFGVDGTGRKKPFLGEE